MESELIEQLVASPPRLDPASLGPADHAREQLPERIREAVGTVEEKATPDEVEQYRGFILGVADVVAHTNKVSEQEQAVLDQLAGELAVGRQPPPRSRPPGASSRGTRPSRRFGAPAGVVYSWMR